MFERFTDTARRIVVGAQEAAREVGDRHIGTEHVLLGLLRDGGDTVAGHVLADSGLDTARLQGQILIRAGRAELDADALQAIGIDLQAVRERAEEAFGPGALDALPEDRRSRPRGHLPFTAPAKKALNRSLREARSLRDDQLGAEHILLGLLHEDASPAPAILTDLGIGPEHLRDQLTTRLHRAA
jgi:ATP-dependent Clp protease ATP-binding subunit ClpA